MINFIFIIAFFLFSLGSHYFYQYRLYVFQVIGIILLVPFFKIAYLKLKRNRIVPILLFVMYMFLWGSISAVLSGSAWFDVSKLAFPVFILLYFIFSVVVFCAYPKTFQRALYIVLWVHVAFFVFQFSYFLTTFHFIDFLEPFTGEEQRAIGGNYSLGPIQNFIRITGLFNEPGTYSTWMMLLLLLFKSNARRLGTKTKSYVLEIFVIGTVLLSFSTFGYIFSLIYLVDVLVEKKLSLKSILLVSVFTIIVASVGYDYFEQRFTKQGDTDVGLDFREQTINLYLDNLNPGKLLFGFGMFDDSFNRKDEKLEAQDLGLWFTLVTSGGIVAIVLLGAFFFLVLPKETGSYSLLVVLLLSKFTLTSALVWLVIFYFLFSKKLKAEPVSLAALPNKPLSAV